MREREGDRGAGGGTPATAADEQGAADLLDDVTFEVFDVPAKAQVSPPMTRFAAPLSEPLAAPALPMDASAAGGGTDGAGRGGAGAVGAGKIPAAGLSSFSRRRAGEQEGGAEKPVWGQPWFVALMVLLALLVVLGVTVGATRCFGEC